MKNKSLIRRLALLLALVLTFSNIGMHLSVKTALAAGTSGLQYGDNGDGTATVLKYTGSSTNVVIPDTYNGLKVTKIADAVFWNNTSITSVTLPTHAIEIGKNAFNQCSSLTTVNNSKYATIINTGAFGGCTNLKNFTISSSLTVLGDSTFRNSGLTEIFLPGSVRSLQLYVFSNCKSLTKVTIVNPQCKFLNNTVFENSSPTICAPDGSTAQTYAYNNGLKFEVYTGSGEEETEDETSGGGSGSEDESSTGGSGNPDCDHLDTWDDYKDPTCTERGYDKYVCAYCGKVTYEYIDALGHNYDTEYTIDVAATASSEGSKSRHCLNDGCNAKTDVTVIPKLSSSCTTHNYQYTSTSVAATCTSGGTDVYTCTACGATKNVYTNALGHNYGDFVVDVEPTYSSTGIKSKYCSKCNDRTEITTIDMLVCTSHNYVYTSTHTKATCTTKGYELRTCTNCAATKYYTIEALGHDYGDYVVDVEPTYTSMGVKSKYCSKCNDRTAITDIPKLTCTTHDYKYTSTKTAATCTSTGVDIHTCANCGATTNVTTSALDHSYGDYVVDIEPTYTSTGVKSRHCSGCSARTDITTIDKLVCSSHDYEFAGVSKEATCTTNGTQEFICTNCGVTKTEAIAALGHSYGNYVVDVEPTYTSTGVKSKYCGTCGNRAYITTIDKLVCTSHDYKYTSTKKAPTCIATGIDIHTCSICKATTEVTTATTDHVYGDWVVDKDPTVTTTGEKSKHCIYCDARTEITTIPVATCSHNYVYTSTTVEATYTNTGLELHTCTHCGATKNVVIDKLTYIIGDCNGDTEITVSDAVLFRKKLAGMAVDMNDEAADINGDGQVNVADIVRIMKYLAGAGNLSGEA